MLRKTLVATTLLATVSTNTLAEENPENKAGGNGYSFDLFLTLSSDTFDANDDALNTLGSFSGDIKPSIAVSLNSPYRFFDKGNSNIGYYFNYNFKRFDLDEQDTSLDNIFRIDEENLGTSVDGYNLYAAVSVFYNFGKKIITSKKDSSFKAGISAGAGYLKANGNIILTEVANTPLQDVNISGLGAVIGVFFEYRKGPWVFKAEGIGTEVSDGAIDYSYTTFPIEIGYTVNF